MSVYTPPTIELGSDTTEQALFAALATADPADRALIQDLLVRRYTGLVRWLASRYASPVVETDDLLQVGFTGLVLAIQRYDPAYGSDFISFARPTVQGEIRRYFRDKRRWIRLPRKLQEAKAQLRGATETLTHELSRAPTVAEVAARLGVDPELILEALTADDAFNPLSLDAAGGADDTDAWTLGETIGGPDKHLDLVVESATLRPLLAALPERERRIIMLRFFEHRTQDEIGLEVGLSQMHVSRILSRTLLTLREQMSVE